MVTVKPTLSVTVCAISSIEFKGTIEDLSSVQPDIYMPDALGGDKVDLGADNHHFSVNGTDEMVMVDKGLLLALLDQCQRLSSNEAVYDETRNTSFKYSDMNNLILGLNPSDAIKV